MLDFIELVNRNTELHIKSITWDKYSYPERLELYENSEPLSLRRLPEDCRLILGDLIEEAINLAEQYDEEAPVLSCAVIAQKFNYVLSKT